MDLSHFDNSSACLTNARDRRSSSTVHSFIILSTTCPSIALGADILDGETGFASGAAWTIAPEEEDNGVEDDAGAPPAATSDGAPDTAVLDDAVAAELAPPSGVEVKENVGLVSVAAPVPVPNEIEAAPDDDSPVALDCPVAAEEPVLRENPPAELDPVLDAPPNPNEGAAPDPAPNPELEATNEGVLSPEDDEVPKPKPAA